MKTIFCIFLTLLLAPIHAGTTEAVSGVFAFDVRDTVGTTEAESSVFLMDGRYLGNAASGGSAEFVLNTLGSTLANVEIVGPSSVVAGSETDYKVLWHAGNSDIDVTSGAQWRFQTDTPGNTGMLPPRLYAGETIAAVTVRIVASYRGIDGTSQETAPFSITITPRMQVELTASRRDPSGLVDCTAVVQGASGSTIVNWDLDEDGLFDDATGNSAAWDYGTWTGTAKIKAEVIDGLGNRRIAEVSVLLNKVPEVNQQVVAKPAYDPGGFSLVLPDAARSPFVFNADGLVRRNSGLVVIAHGLYSSGQSDWMREMGAAIESRCEQAGMTPPDIALLDWSELAEDPSELPAWQKAMLKQLIEAGLKKQNVVAVGTGAAGEAINLGFDLYWVKQFGLTTGQMLANWIYLNSQYGEPPQIDSNAPIHLIGHSAGGFVVGEAAKLLKYPQGGAFQPVYVDRVTMLDTPFVEKSHIAMGGGNYPDPGTAERYVSSVWGALAFGWPVFQNTWYRYQNIWSSLTPGYDLVSHGYAHDWFTRNSIWNSGDPEAELAADGFALSPILNAGTRISKPVSILAFSGAACFSPASFEFSDIVPINWETFGNVSESDGTWTLTESVDAGIWKEMALPVTAGTLAFEFHFTGSGDGDFLAVHFGDNPVLYRGLDLPLSRDAWLPAEISLEMLPDLNGKLVFTLVSRGGVNAQVQLRSIRITQTEDPDCDGLTVDQEIAAGIDPRNPDTDNDGISDGDEINLHNTDPLRADTDGDGQPDASELTAGTNPLANGSVFRLTSVGPSPQGGFVLSWFGVAGKTYRVMRTQELGSQNYETLAFGVVGISPTTMFIDPTPPPQGAFYWIAVE